MPKKNDDKKKPQTDDVEVPKCAQCKNILLMCKCSSKDLKK